MRSQRRLRRREINRKEGFVGTIGFEAVEGGEDFDFGPQQKKVAFSSISCISVAIDAVPVSYVSSNSPFLMYVGET